MQTREFVDEVLADFGEGDYLLLQNEINMLDYIIDQAYEKKMKIIMNPSPFDDKLNTCDLGKIYLFLLNEIEGEQITGYKDKDQILYAMAEKFPNARFVLTLGSDGAVYYDGKESARGIARLSQILKKVIGNLRNRQIAFKKYT